jgi:hypothetical protein
MAATALPSSGQAPEPGRTCDASGMVEIHRLFRAGFGEAPELIHGVAEGNIEHAALVASQLRLLSATLHGHHEGEDSRLWSTIESRAPGCADHVDRMKAQHAVMLRHLDDLDESMPAWRTTGKAADAQAVLTAVVGINRALTEHLGDEEDHIVPVMETTMTPAEVEWFGRHGRKSTPKGQTWYMLGAIMRGQPDGGNAWLRKNLPAPIRLLWRLVGQPKYARYRAGLEGRAIERST